MAVAIAIRSRFTLNFFRTRPDASFGVPALCHSGLTPSLSRDSILGEILLFPCIVAPRDA